MPVDIESSYALSPTQQGMLFHSLYAQQTGVDVEQILCVLHEDLNPAAFQKAWERVVSRHSALRASFRWEGLSEPLQEIHRDGTLTAQIEDLRDLPRCEQRKRLDGYIRSDRKRGFDLAKPPLMRLAVFHMDEAEYEVVWTFHHILADGRSHRLILNEVFAFYEALCRGQELKLPRPSRYGDYIQWLQKQDFSRAEEFWRKKLKGFSAVTSFAVSGSAGNADEDERGEQETTLSQAVTATLLSVADQNQLTLNTFLQGAWGILLSRYSGERDVLFGVVRAARQSTVEGAESIVGMFINTLPLRLQVSPEESLLSWLKEIRARNIAVRPHEHTPLVMIQSWSEKPAGVALFESILVFDNYSLNFALRAQGESWQKRNFRLIEKTSYPLTIYGYGGSELSLKIAYDRRRFDDATIAGLLGHLKTLLEGMAENSGKRLSDLPLLTEPERRQLLVEWNSTETQYSKNACLHQLFEAQVEKTPEAIAVTFEDRQLNYRELNNRANQLAHHLQKLGVGPDVLVGICVERSIEMMIGLLGILKAGGAYVPLDPAYPKERLGFMIEDSRAHALLTQSQLLGRLPIGNPQHAIRNPTVICLDSDSEIIAAEPQRNPLSPVTAENLAYVIYTSGSTGRPKGVMVAHRNVVSFFAGMDRRIGNESTGVWLAVTSISFDISILELFWTLTRGFHVVVHGDNHLLSSAELHSQIAEKEIEFSLFYFASNEGEVSEGKYRLLMEGAKFADEHGFSAVWTPERHFHAFGGLYPNPSVTSAALAAVTKSLKIRAGSVVLPLQNPIRVAEEWAVVDNLSNGRAGISFASGWHANDFVFAPENYQARREIMFREIETVQELWRGKTVSFKGGAGNDVQVKIFPRPIQRELPIWITAAGSPETFRMAGEMGANLLTHLLGQDIEELAKKIAAYRQARRRCGRDPSDGHVTLMLHTFVGESTEAVREKIREPFLSYLKSSSDLVQKLAQSLGQNGGLGDLTEDEMKPHWERAFNRYFETSGLFGAPETCLEMIARLKANGVDEVACLVDFGVDTDSVLSSLRYLDMVRARSNKKPGKNTENFPLAAQIKKHKVSHLQCTPSMARMLTMDTEALDALRSVSDLMLGGEALPVSLAEQMTELASGRVHNMYGPTETTIWSATHPVAKVGRTVPIGRPVANTQIYILDAHLHPIPIGLAGEIFIGGAGVVRGYFERAELTAERFIPDPFSREPGARLYRTGDLARYLPDGNVEFLGRLDHQVKIRGHRIELGEIESVLEGRAAVREAVVIMREDTPGENRLVAYLTAKEQPFPSIDELREFLTHKLPDYMVPSAFVLLDALPLTPNGKVDRRALPMPDQARPAFEKPFVAPSNPLEEVLAGTWAKLLGVERVGTDDNFFELGGHSLFAVRLISQLRTLFKVELPLRTLFDTPTVAALSRAIIANETRRGQSERIAQVVKKIEGMSTEDVRKTLQE
ncbi:MAG: MupA/Atu3671 family FMN-dependent luciferase-like monooxygenase, partial [Candidatus Binatia bacterium]